MPVSYNEQTQFAAPTLSSRPSTSGFPASSHAEIKQFAASKPTSRPSTSGETRVHAEQQYHQHRFQQLDDETPAVPTSAQASSLKRPYPTPQSHNAPHATRKNTSATTLHIPPTIEENLNADTLSHANLVGFGLALASTTTTIGTTLHADAPALNAKRRRTTMTDLICRYLRDENFLKLADEVEGEWSRVLGGF